MDIKPIYEAVILMESSYYHVLIGKEYGIIKTKSKKGIFKKPSNKAL